MSEVTIKMPKKTKIFSSLNKVRRYMKRHQYMMLIAFVVVLASTVLALIGPYFVQELTNTIINGIIVDPLTGLVTIALDMKEINSLGILIISIYLLSFVFAMLQSLLFNHVTQNVAESLRNDIAKKINKLPLRYFDSTTHGDILSRVVNDVDLLSSTLNNSLSTIISSLTMMVGAIIILFIFSWQIGLVVLALIPVTVIFTLIIMKRGQKYFVGSQKKTGDLSGYIEETYTGQRIIKTFDAIEKRQDEFDEINKSVRDFGWKSQFFSSTLFPIVNFVGGIAFVFATVIAALLIGKGGTVLTIASIPMLAIYINSFNQSIGRLGQSVTDVQSAAAASTRIFEFVDADEMSDESHITKRIELDEVKGLVEIKNAKFGYDPGRVIINDFTMYAKPGQKIAIVGPTGAGKTTVVNLLMRFYDIDEGDITIDGTSVYDIKRHNVRELFGMVLQDTWLFTGTIYENLTYGKENVTLEDVRKAAKLANVDHYIQSMPGGYDVILDENADISQGQRQLLTIARAMVQDAPMLILDEATSNVDTRTELLIQEAMDNLMKGRTTFVIAHRLSTIKNSNLILVMKDGNIIEKGSHDELMEAKGFYTELYNSQFSS